MSTTNHDNKLLLKYRDSNTLTGVTRDTARRIANILGLNETQMIHLAIAQLAKQVLPAYEPDDGPLKSKQLAAINKLVPQDRPFTVTKSLF